MRLYLNLDQKKVATKALARHSMQTTVSGLKIYLQPLDGQLHRRLGLPLAARLLKENGENGCVRTSLLGM